MLLTSASLCATFAIYALSVSVFDARSVKMQDADRCCDLDTHEMSEKYEPEGDSSTDCRSVPYLYPCGRCDACIITGRAIECED